MDDAFGAVMEAVREMGQAENTIYIWSTDHGVDVTAGKFTCYQGGTRIPYAMMWEGKIEPGTTCDAMCENIDFIPTLFEAIGLPLPETLQIDGVSHWQQLLGAPDKREDLYFEWGYTRAVRTHRWKYIAYRPTRERLAAMKEGSVDRAYNHSGRLAPTATMPNYPHYFAPDQLYDLKADPGEQTNLADDLAYAEVLAEMQARLQSYLEGFKRPFDLSVDPFLNSEAYQALTEVTRADDRIYRTYWYRQNAY
jgi:arylsulfatase A-like enzyme